MVAVVPVSQQPYRCTRAHTRARARSRCVRMYENAVLFSFCIRIFSRFNLHIKTLFKLTIVCRVFGPPSIASVIVFVFVFSLFVSLQSCARASGDGDGDGGDGSFVFACMRECMCLYNGHGRDDSIYSFAAFTL